MPRMSRIIEGCAYNPEASILAFRFKDMRIVVERNRILINQPKDESEAQTVIDWLASIVNGTDEQVTKQEAE